MVTIPVVHFSQNISHKTKIRWFFLSLFMGVTTWLTAILQIFAVPDRYLTDILYQQPGTIDPNIKIVAIDDRTLERYGPIQSWTRQQYADVINKLNQNYSYAPAAIGLDVLFSQEMDTVGDMALVDACAKGKNVVVAESIVFRNTIKVNAQGRTYLDRMAIDSRVQPYSALLSVTKQGFVNTLQDAQDGYIRKSLFRVEADKQSIYSFSSILAKTYSQKIGQPISWPTLDEKSAFGFLYTAKTGAYETISICDLLDGKIPEEAFQNSIVLIGTCSAGMMDSYSVPLTRGIPMFGVEIHANIVQALLEEKYLYPFPLWISSVLSGILCATFFYLCSFLPIWLICMSSGMLIGGELLLGINLVRQGQELSLLPLPFFLILGVGAALFLRYHTERTNRQQIITTFEKYVAPQVVQEIMKDSSFHLKLGGENREIAVLFVDIRGFTPMSESLEPEQVVEILNEYLGAVTDAIFHYGGTLDKFIGDAAMAIFNAPQNLKDPAFQAVCAALEIRSHSDHLAEQFQQRFGRSVSYGIGINYGHAVVGNIGCDFRMDYTAIGDTVNTAARLEANAKSNQILISQSVLNELHDRAEVSLLGEIPLKGKSKGVTVYQLCHLKQAELTTEK